MIGLQWWKSTAKWEAEQEMDDCTDLNTLQPSLTLSGNIDTQEDNGMQHRKVQTHRNGQSTVKLHPTTRSGPTSRKHCVNQHLPKKRLSHKTPKRNTDTAQSPTSQSPSSSSSQSTASSDDSSDSKHRKTAWRDEQVRIKTKEQIRRHICKLDSGNIQRMQERSTEVQSNKFGKWPKKQAIRHGGPRDAQN